MAAEGEQKRLELYFTKLADLIPEPPKDWRKRMKPPGSAPRTSGLGLAESEEKLCKEPQHRFHVLR
jgi:hypothetical protein